MEGADEDMDLETAQAQLDMAMAFTDSLVTGWMKASKAKLPSAASRGNNDFDLDEYMRRPPRLGLGASIPPSSSVHSHEASKLRSKLVGNAKKRAREDEDAAPGPSAIVISDDDDESRARTTTKKTRLDPFAPKPKKKAKVDPPTSQPTSSPAKATASSSKAKPTSKVSDVEEIPRPEGLAPSNGTALSTLKKRKKKKKHKANAGAELDTSLEVNASPSHPPAQSHPKSPSQANGVSATPMPATSKTGVITIKDTPPPEASPRQSLLAVALSTARSFFGKVVSADSSIATPATASAQVSPARPRPPKPVPQLSPQRLDPFGNPLLNLDGHPPDAGDEAAGSAKKKRKRKKKKKKHIMAEAAAGMEVIDVDADDEDED